jgi:hypothetical protein
MGIPLAHIRCDFEPKRDAAILRSIKSLKTINEKPAAEFWKEVDGQQSFVPLFNGQNLTGWASAPGRPNYWNVVDGAITCTGPESW